MNADNRDLDHIRLLTIFHYVMGGLIGFVSCIPVIHLAIGIFMILNPGTFQSEGQEATPVWAGWLFAILGGVFILMGWSFAICIILAGRFLNQRKNYLYCMIMAGILCLFMPLGTLLGVFTIIVLMRQTVKDLFGYGAPSG